MRNLTLPIAVAVLTMSSAFQAFADNYNQGDDLQGQGFENSGNRSSVLNAGAGNGGEHFMFGTPLGPAPNESDFQTDRDPGRSFNNQAPSQPPGQTP